MQCRFYDRKCVGPSCGKTFIDCYEPTEAPVVKCDCGYITERVWLAKSSAVISDECDVLVRHGLCDLKTGEPVRYRSKSEMARVAKERGLVNFVTHQGTKGGDRSPHTRRWI